MTFDKNDYPALGFNFKVTSTHSLSGSPQKIAENLAKNLLAGGPTESYFQSISGISASVQKNPTVDGGINNRQYNLPGPTTYSDLILSRGIMKSSSELTKWCRTFLLQDNFYYGVERRTINVMLLDRSSDNILMTWSFFNCYPTKITIGDFNARASGDNAIAIETLEVAYSNYYRYTGDGSLLSLTGIAREL